MDKKIKIKIHLRYFKPVASIIQLSFLGTHDGMFVCPAIAYSNLIFRILPQYFYKNKSKTYLKKKIYKVISMYLGTLSISKVLFYFFLFKL